MSWFSFSYFIHLIWLECPAAVAVHLPFDSRCICWLFASSYTAWSALKFHFQPVSPNQLKSAVGTSSFHYVWFIHMPCMIHSYPFHTDCTFCNPWKIVFLQIHKLIFLIIQQVYLFQRANDKWDLVWGKRLRCMISLIQCRQKPCVRK